ncbi:MAG: GntR family transcriptional regulator [Granulosicoccus sp.]
MLLNAQSPIPLYRQLADRILAAIDAGEHKVASKIPSEQHLAATYAIGRPTVRQATDLLVRQGRLERRRGSGTYVLPPSRSIDLFSLAGTSAALQKSELDAEMTLVAGPMMDAGAFGATGAGEHLEPHVRIERRTMVSGAPVLYETLWFNAALFVGIEQQPLADKSVAALVRDVYFLEPTSADQTFYAIVADEKLAKRLHVDIGAPLLRVLRELHFGENSSALVAEIVCPTDRFEFSQTLYPARDDQNNNTVDTADF